jgi:hypothetical protein
VTPETAAFAAALLIALGRELLSALEKRRRRRGELQTRADDPSGNAPTS